VAYSSCRAAAAFNYCSDCDCNWHLELYDTSSIAL